MTAKYDRIGINYNETRRADPYLTGRLLHHLRPEPGKRYLDIGCGTGNYTRKMAASGFQFVGVDPSEEMLSKARQSPESIDWRKGRVEAIPLEDGTVNGVIAGLTLHHWTDMEAGFRELGRVMCPGARIVMLSATPEQMEGYWLGHYFPRMLEVSTAQMPGLEAVAAAMEKAGLELLETELYFVHDELEDWFMQSGKRDPARYLDPRVRKGISTFADLARRDEVGAGLARLEKDIASGEIKRVMAEYENELGDYIFIVGRKPVSPAP